LKCWRSQKRSKTKRTQSPGYLMYEEGGGRGMPLKLKKGGDLKGGGEVLLNLRDSGTRAGEVINKDMKTCRANFPCPYPGGLRVTSANKTQETFQGQKALWQDDKPADNLCQRHRLSQWGTFPTPMSGENKTQRRRGCTSRLGFIAKVILL